MSHPLLLCCDSHLWFFLTKLTAIMVGTVCPAFFHVVLRTPEGGLCPPTLFISNGLIKGDITASAPLTIIEAVLHIPAEGRVLPVLGCFCQSVLYRVVVNVIDMGIIILLVPYLMFPKSSLPYAPLPMSDSGRRRVGCAHHLFHHITRTFRKLFKEIFSFDMRQP